MVKYYYDRYVASSTEVISKKRIGYENVGSAGGNVNNWVTAKIGGATLTNDIYRTVRIGTDGGRNFVSLSGNGDKLSSNPTFSGVYYIIVGSITPGTRSAYFQTVGGLFDAIRYELEIQYISGTTCYVALDELSLGVEYSKSALLQANVIAEDGTYPANGRHTDGYWYVKKTVANTAPTQPGPFTQPSGTLEIGDSKVFTVGAATDAESNLSKYVWEASVNGVAYTKVGETSVPNLTYTIPTATSLKMRVKAVDAAGLESVYRESSQFTVSKPVYYWSKYTVGQHTYYEQSGWYGYSVINGVGNLGAGYKSYSLDSTTGIFSGSGGKWGVDPPISSYSYGIDGKQMYRYAFTKPAYYSEETCSTIQKTMDIRGTLVQSNITALEGAYPTNGKHTDGFWYVRGLRVNQSIAPTGKFTAPTTDKIFKPNEVANVAFEASSAPSIVAYEVDYRFGTGAWTPLAYNNTLSRSLTITTDKTLKTLELRVRAKNTSNVYSDYVYSEVFTIEHNVAPTASLTNPSDNTTLYENDTLNIAGTAHDADADQSVTVYYQINSEPRKVLATNLSQTQISLSKQLTFKGGKIYDGDTAISAVLADGVAHTLKVWAVDSENAQSVEVERTFYVVPNRAPLLTVDSIVPSGVVDTDKFKISGTSSDLDANSNVTVTSRINAGNAVEIYNGPGGAWEFEILLAQLVVGVNTIVIEVIDNYGAKASKTIKLNKDEVKTPILHSVARYKIEPPKGTAKGVLIWIQRDEALEIAAELSMTLKGEQESYMPLVATNTAPVTQGIVEDEYYHETLEPKENIILKISMSRSSTTVNNKINLISGVLE